MKEITEAKKIVEGMANVLSSIRKIRYVGKKLKELDEVYHYSSNFKASEPGHIELETTTKELAKGNIIKNGVYLITNIWIFKDEIHGYLTSFVVRTGKRKEVIVFGENPKIEPYDVKPNKLFFIVACNEKIKIDSSYLNVNVANTYKLKGMDVYELHKQVVEFLDSFLFDTGCDAKLLLKEQFKI
jgi:hypothetical protein